MTQKSRQQIRDELFNRMELHEQREKWHNWRSPCCGARIYEGCWCNVLKEETK